MRRGELENITAIGSMNGNRDLEQPREKIMECLMQ